jgi:hypothetical protein
LPIEITEEDVDNGSLAFSFYDIPSADMCTKAIVMPSGMISMTRAYLEKEAVYLYRTGAIFYKLTTDCRGDPWVAG